MAKWKKKDLDALFVEEGFISEFGTCEGMGDPCGAPTVLRWDTATQVTDREEYFRLVEFCPTCRVGGYVGHVYMDIGKSVLTRQEAIGISEQYLAERNVLLDGSEYVEAEEEEED